MMTVARQEYNMLRRVQSLLTIGVSSLRSVIYLTVMISKVDVWVVQKEGAAKCPVWTARLRQARQNMEVPIKDAFHSSQLLLLTMACH
eukprot:scaffold94873_cov41-Attheya_sp.AAC.2